MKKIFLPLCLFVTSFQSIASDCSIMLAISDKTEERRQLIISELKNKGYDVVYEMSARPKYLLKESTKSRDGEIPPGQPLFDCSYFKLTKTYYIEDTKNQKAYIDSYGRVTYSNAIISQSSEKKLKFPFICADHVSTLAKRIENNSMDKIVQAIQELKSCDAHL